MILAMSAAACLLAAGCGDPAALVREMTSPFPLSGTYVSLSGERYRVGTTGPTALSVRAEDGGLCLRFWKEKRQPASALVKLRGQTCANRTFNSLDWTVLFPTAKPNVVIL